MKQRLLILTLWCVLIAAFVQVINLGSGTDFISDAQAQGTTGSGKVERKTFIRPNETLDFPVLVTPPTLQNDAQVELRVSVSNIAVTAMTLSSLPQGFNLETDAASGIANNTGLWRGTISAANGSKTLPFTVRVTTGSGSAKTSVISARLISLSNQAEYDSNDISLSLAAIGKASITPVSIANTTPEGDGFQPIETFGSADQPSPDIFPAAKIHYQITWTNTQSFPIKLTDQKLIARISHAGKPDMNSVLGRGTFNTSNHAIEWNLKDLVGSDEVAAGASYTTTYTVILDDDIPFGVNETNVGAQAYVSEQETGEKFQGELVKVPLSVDVPVTIINYYGNPVQQVFTDIFSANSDVSIDPKTDLSNHLSDADGHSSVVIKRSDLTKKGEARFGVAFANSTLGTAIRGASWNTADIENIRTEPLALKSTRSSPLDLYFTSTTPSMTGEHIIVTPDQWQFPSVSDRPYHDQIQMASVIWNNIIQGKRYLSKLGGLPSDAPLSVNLLPKGTDYSYFKDENLYLSQRDWRPRAEGAYSTDTELHELSHWFLTKLGIDRIMGTTPPHVDFPLDVPVYGQTSENCGDVAYAMVRDYFRKLANLSPLHADPKAICYETGSPQLNPNRDIPAPYNHYITASGQPDFSLIDSSLNRGAPVIFYSNLSISAGQHVFVIVGYDPDSPSTNRLYYINDPDGGVQGTTIPTRFDENGKLPELKVVPVTRDILARNWHFPNPGFTYYDGPPIFGSNLGELFGLDAASYGYANSTTNNSMVEGLAIDLAVETDNAIHGTSDTKYRNEENSALYNLNTIDPAFVTFSPLYKNNQASPQGEGWSVAGLVHSLVHGLPKTVTSQTFAWTRSATLRQYNIPSITLGIKGLISRLKSGSITTIAKLRHHLTGTGKAVTLTTKNGQEIHTTTLDLLMGLYGFFPDRDGNWVLDRGDFSHGSGDAVDQFLLGKAAHSGPISVKLPKITYDQSAETSTLVDFQPLPSSVLGKPVDQSSQRGDAIPYVRRFTSGSLPFDTGGRLSRSEPLEIPGSKMRILSNSDDPVTMHVSILVAEPNADFSYSYDQTVTPGQPVTLQLPYPTYQSTAVLRFDGSADWIVIPSGSYWDAVAGSTSPIVFAEKYVVHSGSMPSLDSVLAAAGLAPDGRDPNQTQTDTLTDTPTSVAAAVDIPPAPTGEAEPPEASVNIVEQTVSESGHTEETIVASDKPALVQSGDIVLIHAQSLSHGTASVSVDNEEAGKFQVIGDGQEFPIQLPGNLKTGRHEISIADSAGHTYSVFVSAVNTHLSLWVIVLLLVSIALLSLIFWYVWLRSRRSGQPSLPVVATTINEYHDESQDKLRED